MKLTWHSLVLATLLGFLSLVCAAAEAVEAGSDCRNVVVLTGFWPPTNEMLRPWSTSQQQNPEGWQGSNWQGTGYDIYAFFPEFPPDGDPTNDDIGDLGSVGAVGGDFQVDYQDASADFWRVVDQYRPRILITTSRGGQIGWELEAVEGGHGAWVADRFGSSHLPNKGTVEPRTSQALTTFQVKTLTSQLPLDLLETGLKHHNPRVNVLIDQNTSGNYLSGFLGLHGLYYNHISPANLAAGHIHVGKGVSPADAQDMMIKTLEVVLANTPKCAV